MTRYRTALLAALLAAGTAHAEVSRQTHRGLEVVGGGRARRAERGRWLASRDAAVPPSLAVDPAVPAERAAAAAAGVALDPARHARLVVLADPGLAAPRLAWQVVFAEAGRTWQVHVDAHSGAVLQRVELSRRARARVYPINPVDSALAEVDLGDLPGGALVDGDVAVVNCIDARGCHPVLTRAGVRQVHFCELQPTAAADGAGDFLHLAPPRRATEPEDAFAEVQAYHHVRTALGAFRRWLGDPDFALDQPLTVIVNLRSPDLSTAASGCAGPTAPADSELVPEDNAYFWPAGELGPTEVGDRIVMGQGERVDWAYDGEVVYHELTHAVMHTLTPLAWHIHDRLGIDPAPGALHEGFSDYFAAAITGNPELARYAGTTEDGPAPLGSLLAARRCDQILIGEEHDESAPWAAALWAIRRSLRSEAKREMFNGALVRAVARLGRSDGFARAQELVLAELGAAAEDFIAGEGLDAAAAAELRAQVARAPEHFASFGLPDCGGRVLALAPGARKDALYLRGPNWYGVDAFGDQLLPATMQIRIELEQPTDVIAVNVESSFGLDDELKFGTQKRVPRLEVLLKRGAEPIAWTWDLPAGAHDAERAAELALDDDGAGRALLRGPWPAGVYHLQLGNRGADWAVEGIAVLIAGDDGKLDDPGAPASGGGCAVGGRAEPAAAVLVLLAGALTGRRRRAARAPRPRRPL